MPVRPTFLENILFLRLNQGPALLFDLFGAGAFRALAVSVELGLFEVIGEEALSSDEISSRIRCDRRATGILLQFLTSLGYLTKERHRYSNSPVVKKWVLRSSPTSLADMISVWAGEVFPFWDENLVTAIREGRPSASLYEQFNTRPGAWRAFSSFEMAIANWLRGPLLAHVKLPPKATRLLDVGGGHGLYSIMFCEKYPELSATVFDKPDPLEVAKDNVKAHGMNNRIRLQSGDFLVDDLGEGYDVALLFNIVHNFREEQNVELLRRVASALRREGSIVLWDNIAGPGVSKSTIDFFGLTYLVTVGGQTYSLGDLKRWFEKTGFTAPKSTLRLPGLVQSRRK